MCTYSSAVCRMVRPGVRKLVLLFSCWAALTPVLAETGVPELNIVEAVHDFGRVRSGTQVRHEFVVANAGDAPLVINHVRTTCLCAAAELTGGRIEIPAKGRAAMPVVFATQGRRGRQTTILYLNSNDPQRPIAVCQLVGEVVPAFDIDPEPVNFGLVTHGEGATMVVAVRNNFGTAFRVVSVESGSPHIAVRAVGGRWRRRDVTLHVVCAATAPVGPFRTTIRLVTDDPVDPAQQITVNGRVVGDWLVEPRRIFTSDLRLTGKGEFTVAFRRHRRDGAFRVLDATALHRRVGVRLSELADGTGYHVFVQAGAIADTDTEPVHDVIRVRTDSLLEPVIDIPFEGRLAR